MNRQLGSVRLSIAIGAIHLSNKLKTRLQAVLLKSPSSFARCLLSKLRNRQRVSSSCSGGTGRIRVLSTLHTLFNSSDMH